MVKRVFRAVSKKGIVEILLVLSIGSTLYATPEEGKTLTLVSGGKANCVIVAQPDRLGKRDPICAGIRPLSENIQEFQRILEQMSGVKIPVVGPDQVTSAGVKIYIGQVPLPNGLSVDETTLDPRGYCIVATENAVVLRGKTYGGTINALYGFLQDKLGVRWFFPTKLFEVIPRQDTLRVEYCSEIHNPSFKGAMFTVGAGIQKEGDVWGERMRRDEGAWKYHGAMVHYLGYILDSAKYGKSHPEFYPLINGQRSIPAPGDRSAPQPCLSNPELVKVVVEFCRKTFDENPNALMVAIGENDSRDWCSCEKCQKMDVLPLEKFNESEQHSDRYFTFANQVARAVNESHPGKMVGCLAYDGTVTPPKKIDKLEPNVAIGMCIDSSQYYDPKYKTKDYNTLAAWKPKCRNICTYDYLGLNWPAPRYYPHLYAQHLKEMHEQGILVKFTEPCPCWPTFGPMIYLATQLMWDIKQNPDVILNDLFSGLFGKEAGAEMKAYYEVFENAWMRPKTGRNGKYFEGWSSMREQMAIFELADLDEALKHLALAKALAKDPVIRQRVEYIERGFAYAATSMRGWLLSDTIDAVINGSDLQSPEDAVKLRDKLLMVAAIMKQEPLDFKAASLSDPISYPAWSDSHWGIIRGQWTSRCNYSLRLGLSSLLKYYNLHQMSEQEVALKTEFPADIWQAAKTMVGESFGPELILNGNMEEGNPPDNWQRNNSELSASSDSHSGKQSLKISASADFGGALQSITVKPDTQYRMDCWFKCSRPGGMYVCVNTNSNDGGNLFGDLKDNSEWTRFTAKFRTPNKKDVTTAWVNFCSFPGKDTLIDDISIKEVETSNLMVCKKVDAKFPDWSNPTFVLDRPEYLGNNGSNMTAVWRGAVMFSAAACLGWDESGLRLSVKVKDVDHDQPNNGDAMWNGDSLQFGIDAGADGDKRPFGGGFDNENDFLYGLSLLDRPGSSPELYRWNAPKGKLTGDMPSDDKKHRFNVKVENGMSLYNFFVSWEELGMSAKVGNKIGFNLVVFDRYKKEDKTDVLMWMQLTPGIAGSSGKSPGLWRNFIFKAR